MKPGNILHYNHLMVEGVAEEVVFLTMAEVEAVVQSYRLVEEVVEEPRRLVVAVAVVEQLVDSIDNMPHSFDIPHRHYRDRFHSIGHTERCNLVEPRLLVIDLSRELSGQVYSY